MGARRERPAAAAAPEVLALDAMPTHLRWVDSGDPRYPELRAEQKRWLSDRGWGPMDYVLALTPGGGQ